MSADVLKAPLGFIAALVAVLIAACAHPTWPASAPSGAPAPHVNPVNIKRVGRELPAGYEVTSVTGMATPAPIWGLGTGWTADPPQCATLADPANGRGQSARGVTGSGSGGIVYAVVASPSQGAPEPRVLKDCSGWTMTNGRATARVRLTDPPHIEGVQTVGMTSDTETSVEGGNEINSRANTFIAYLGDYYAFTALITDPGSAHPPLTAQFAADLLAKTVYALRS